MDEIMNNDTSTTWTGNDNALTFTNGTSDYGQFLSASATVDFTFYEVNLDEWPKGVTSPQKEFQYNPEWHIIQGYKNQFKSMWD